MNISSIAKKGLMAVSGFILAAFVLVHMAGNLQMFAGPDAMNHYANMLQTLPYGLLWVSRIILLLAVIVHAWMAILLTLENRRARPENYAKKSSIQATFASKTMGLTGSILLLFIVFHIAHFTIHNVFPVYKTSLFYTLLDGAVVYNVYKMVIFGFTKPWISGFYILAMAILCTHLSHGVTSMFQSIGWRNDKWKSHLDIFSVFYGWIVFLGFISVPVAVLMSFYTSYKIFPIILALNMGL